MKKFINIKIILLAFVIVVYSPILFSYFQQDEWHNFAWHMSNLELGPIFAIKKALFSFLPITQTFNLLNYYILGIQNYFPAIIVLSLIVLNSFFWEKNVYRISKNKLISLGSLAFGYLSFLPHQSIAWVLPSIATQGSFLFINLSIYFFLKFKKNKKKKYLFLSLLMAVFATFTKSNSFFIFIFIPFLYLILETKKISKTNIKKMVLGLISLGLIALTIIFLQPKDFKVGSGRFVNNKKTILINSIILPIKSISQIILGSKVTYKLASDLLVVYYQKTPDPLSVYTIFTDYISLMIGFISILLYSFSFKINKKNKKIFYFGILFYFLSLSPYFLDKFSTGTGFLESRYYYLSSFSLGILIFTWINQFYQNLDKNKLIKTKAVKNQIKILFAVIIIFFLGSNALHINKYIKLSNKGTRKRAEILKFAKKEIYPHIDGDFIIFIDDINHPNIQLKNITGSYFQTGFIYPFLVYSYEKENPKIDFNSFKEEVYWNMNYQGCDRVSKQEICLFYDYQALLKELKEKKFDYNQIFSLKFDYKKMLSNKHTTGFVDDLQYVEYSNNSDSFRERLKSDLTLLNEN